MKAEVKRIESYKQSLTVEVPVDEVQPALEKAYRKYQGKVKIDGFRKGKAPMSMIKKRYGDAIESEVGDDLIQTFYIKAIEENKIQPVAPGSIKEALFKEGEPLTFTAEIEVEPEVTVKDYTGIKVEREIQPVNDEDVDKMLAYLQEQRVERNPVDIGAETGHLLLVDFQALDDTGFPMVGQKWEKQMIELGASPWAGGVELPLIGVKAGETRRAVIPPPPADELHSEGKAQQLGVFVHQVMEKKLPALDDAFAKKLGDYEGMDALKSSMRDNLRAQRDRDSEDKMRHQLSDVILKKNDFDLPPALIENAMHSFWEDHQARSGSNESQKEQLLQQYRPMLVWNLKWDRIRHAIAETEGLVVDDAALDAEIERIAKDNAKEEKKIRVQLNRPEQRRRLQRSMLEEKTMLWLIERAKVKEVTIKPEKKKRSKIIAQEEE